LIQKCLRGKNWNKGEKILNGSKSRKQKGQKETLRMTESQKARERETEIWGK